MQERDGDTKMYTINELKEHVIIQGKPGEQVVVDDEQHYNEVGHLIIDGQVYISFSVVHQVVKYSIFVILNLFHAVLFVSITYYYILHKHFF